MNRAYDTRKPYYASYCVIFTCACDGDDINCYISYVSTIHTDAMWLLFLMSFLWKPSPNACVFHENDESSQLLYYGQWEKVHRRKIRLQSETHKWGRGLKGTTSRFAQLEVFSLNFSNSWLEIRANLLDPSLWFIIISLVLFYLNLLLFSCFYPFKGSFLLGQNFSKLSSLLILFRYLVCSFQWHQGWTLISVALEYHSSSLADLNTRYSN